MRANLEFYSQDVGSLDNWGKCGLGINHKTGRLQWCPGCSCYKIIIIICAIMIPIILMFIFLTRLNVTNSVSLSDEIYVIDNTIDDNIDMNEREYRCVPIRYGLSETINIEERDLLKDVRTSFIPADCILIPKKSLNQNNEIIHSQFDESNYFEIISRLKRAFDGNLTEDILIDNDDIEADNVPTDEKYDNMPFQNTFNKFLERKDDEKKDVDEILKIDSDIVGFHSFWKGEGNQENIRTTQSEIMRKYMDPLTDPCTDFYQFACGNWEKLNPIPKDKAGYDTFEMLRESLDTVLRDLLTEHEKRTLPSVENSLDSLNEQPGLILARESTTTDNGLLYPGDIKNTLGLIKLKKRKRDILQSYYNRIIAKREANEINAELKAKHLYASCMNSDILEKRGIEPLLKLLRSLGGWPVLEPNWSEEQFDWLNLTAKLRLYNNDIFIVEWVGPDIKNSDENIIQFDQTSLGLPTRDYFLHESNSQYLEAYRNFMATTINLLGASTAKSMETADEIIEFETELARITSSSDERANVSVLYKRMNLQALHQQVPDIDWTRYLSLVQERPVNNTEVVVIYAIDYMKHLVVLLSKTNPKTISNYLLWRFVRHRINNLDERFQDGKQKFFQVLFGREQSPPKWKNCVGQVNSNMGMALGAMFVRKYFDENSKEDTLEMTHELQDAFRLILNTTSWLDPATRHLAELKVNAMSLKIGYPDFILSPEELNKKYEGLNIDPEKYFENTLNVLIHVNRIEQNKLSETVNKTIWQTAPAIVNAYYSRNKNQIMFPAGILQPPFYHRQFPRSLNYGGIGVVIGHELTHGFDDKGRLFDRDGNIHKWWTDQAINGFHERARCLISQYSNYTVSEVGIPINGESTQGENIADNGGIRQAFHAYTNWLQRNWSKDLEKSETLPDLNMTGKQLFFLNFAQVWCGVMRPEATRNKLKTAVHSPGKFRVIGTLSNSVDFAREFQCPAGSPMNPIQKCSVW